MITVGNPTIIANLDREGGRVKYSWPEFEFFLPLELPLANGNHAISFFFSFCF